MSMDMTFTERVKWAASVDEAVAHIQSQVDAQLSMLGDDPIVAFDRIDRDYIEGRTEVAAVDLQGLAAVPWIPFAAEMEHAGMSQQDIETVLARVEWFKPEVATHFEGRQRPERPEPPTPPNAGQPTIPTPDQIDDSAPPVPGDAAPTDPTGGNPNG